MFVHQTQFRSTAALLSGMAVLEARARRVYGIAESLRAWLGKRRAARATPIDFRMMSGRELHDIGLHRVDAPNVGWDAWVDIRGRL